MKQATAISLLGAQLLISGLTHAQNAGTYKAPRTAWGAPSIQGYYTNNTDVPFERSIELGDKAFFTEAELQSRRNSRPDAEESTVPGTTADVHYSTAEFGLNPDQNDMVKSLRTSIITVPANGRLPPLRPAAQARSEAARASQLGRTYDSAQDRPLAERCIIWPHEGPPLRPVGYNSHVQIMQTRSHVVLMTEMIHDARIIPIAGSKPDSAGLTRWQGNSWGHWDGDTLVIETTGIDSRVNPRGSNIPLGPEGKIIERLSRTGPGTVLYQFSVTDPALWDTSWGGEFPMELSEGTMIEYACHEGNYGIANTLRGAREEEKAKTKP